MMIELHMLQNFAPSCLNRDDTNAPKDCFFGGVRRARISSQCIKRAIRDAFSKQRLLPVENLAWRTKRLAEEVGRRLADEGKDETQACKAAEVVLGGLGFAVDDEGRTQYLLFIGESGVTALKDIVSRNWDALANVAAKLASPDAEQDKKTAKDAKKAAKEALPKELKDSVAAVLDGSRTADLAMFGRMLADIPASNIEAACQVAHAISTNRVEMEMDFFTAVDDLKPDEEDPGAGMMGVIGFNASCFYRYAVIDFDQLLKNLGGEQGQADQELARKTVEAFLRASATAIPSGKQNTFAAHNPPDLLLGWVRRSGAPLSLANAFARPAQPSGEAHLAQASANALQDYWAKVTDVYGTGELHGPFCCGPVLPTDGDGWTDTGTFEKFVASILAGLDHDGGAA